MLRRSPRHHRGCRPPRSRPQDSTLPGTASGPPGPPHCCGPAGFSETRPPPRSRPPDWRTLRSRNLRHSQRRVRGKSRWTRR